MEEKLESDSVLKMRVQAWIVSISVLLLVAKFVAYFVTNSAAIYTDAMESIVNVVAGFISLYSIHLASQPKDYDHPFGHGKFELLSASLEGLMIMLAGSLIIFEGVKRLFIPAQIESLDVGLILVALAGLVNFIMGSVSIWIGKKYDSIALVASGKHLHSDTYSTIALVVGIAIVMLTKCYWIDSLLAVIFGALIIVTGFFILRNTIANLTDKADSEVLENLLKLLNQHKREEWIDVHNMKVIKYGSYYYIDCDLTLPRFHTIARGHDSYERIKADILEHFSNKVIFSIHFDPCKPKHCKHCKIKECSLRSENFENSLDIDMSCLTGVESHLKN